MAPTPQRTPLKAINDGNWHGHCLEWLHRYLAIAEIGLSDRVDRGFTVTEMAPMDQAIGVPTETTTAFVGRALRGPVNIPVLLHNFGDFRRRFGDVWTRSSLGPAVQSFFEHGGRDLIVVRVANNARGAMICLPASGSALVLRALEPGSAERIRAAVDYDGIESDDDGLFNLTLQRTDAQTDLIIDQEMFRGVSCREDATTFVGDRLMTSTLARIEKPYPTHRPEVTVAASSQYESSYIGHAQKGADGNELSDYDLVGSRKGETGLFALQQVEHFDLLYVPPPAKGRDPGPVAVLAAERYCRERGAMLISDPPAEWATTEDAIKGVRTQGYASPSMIGYFPRVYQRAEVGRVARVAGAAIAGLICRNDRTNGPWQYPDQHGMQLSRRFVAATDTDDDQAQLLARAGLNTITNGAAGRARLTGFVTMVRGSEARSKYSSLSIRRLCLHIVSAIDLGTRWAVFEADNTQLAERIHSQVFAYLCSLAALGAFETDKFVVQCDAGLCKRQNTLEHGVTILLVFQPVGYTEPVSFTLHQTVAGCRVASTAFPPVVEDCA
jgi:phage tail sheath protein FI